MLNQTVNHEMRAYKFRAVALSCSCRSLWGHQQGPEQGPLKGPHFNGKFDHFHTLKYISKTRTHKYKIAAMDDDYMETVEE